MAQKQNLFKKFLLVLIALSTISSCLSAKSAQLLDETSLNQAINSIHNQDYQGAITLLKGFLTTNPSSKEAHYNLGIAYKAIGQLDLAMGEFQLAYQISNPVQSDSKTNTSPIEITANITSQSNSNIVVQEDQSSQETDYLDLGDTLAESGQYQQAIEHYTFALKINSSNTTAMYKIAKAYRALGDLEDSKDFITQALNIAPSNVEYGRFFAEISQSQPQIALEPANKTSISSEQQPVKEVYDAKYYNAQGLDYYKTNELKRAEKYFKKAISFDKKFAPPYNNLGNVEYQKSDYKKAIAYYQDAIKIDKKYADPYFNIAAIYRKFGNVAQELEYLDATIKANPDYYDAYYYRAIILYKKGDVAKAKEDYLTLINAQKYQYEANYNLGVISLNATNNEDAINYFNECLKYNTQNPDVYYLLASTYKITGKYDLAIENYKKVIDSAPNKIKYYADLGKVLLLKEDYEHAKQIYSKAYSLDASNQEILNGLGISCYNLQEYAKAKEVYLKLVELSPNRALFHYNLSQCYMSLNSEGRATREFQRAIMVEPQNLDDFMDLSKIFCERKMYEYAISVLKTGIKKYPQQAYFYYKLAKIYKDKNDIESSNAIMRQLKETNPSFVYNEEQ